MMKQMLSISGMSCQHCKRHVTNALNELNGVQSVFVSLEDRQAIIQVETAFSYDELRTVIEEVGYELTKVE
ncbi:MAG: heavy-metal-associated domain-containing protein [Acholeplasma sp.]|nr:heavy-metal-associated domain-containing protein [Acholeplasma sp.]